MVTSNATTGDSCYFSGDALWMPSSAMDSNAGLQSALPSGGAAGHGELPELTELPGNQDADGDRSVSANEPANWVNRRPGTCILLLETRLARTVIDSLVA